jgi:type II secretory pathway pseudopilin PulG
MARPRRSQSGFALLLVFLMAAILAITLYMEIPRVAFQSQRNREQLLMERGEQYKLAIRRFMQVNKRWPASIDELESLNNRRFLRRRYKDPMTGKDEWRLIHINNGVLTDSKNSTQDKDKKPASLTDSFIAEIPSLGSTPPGAQGANIATRRRASDGAAPGTDPNGQLAGGLPPGGTQPGFPGQAGTLPPGVPGLPGSNSSSTGFPPTLPGPQPGGFPGSPGAPVNSQTGGVSPAPFGGGFVGSGNPFVGGGQPVGSQPNNPAGGQPVYAGQMPYSTAPGANGSPPGFPNPGATTGQPNAAVNMINSILTSPRPGGLAGIQGQSAMGGGAGIAGIASNLDADSIMVYADHTNYSEWEFIYDGKFMPPPDPRQGTGGTPVSQMGNMAGSSPPGTPIGGQQPGQLAQSGQPGQPGQQSAAPVGQQAGGTGTQNTSLSLRPGRP